MLVCRARAVPPGGPLLRSIDMHGRQERQLIVDAREKRRRALAAGAARVSSTHTHEAPPTAARARTTMAPVDALISTS